jgi:tight adherence protein C
MTLAALSFELATLPSGWIIWPLLFGLGAYLLLMTQPLGRPRPDLAELLRRLDVDERLKDEGDQRSGRSLFSSALLERLLRPVLEDAGSASRRWLSRVGLAGGKDLERKLRQAGSGLEPAQFFGQKLAMGVIGLGLFPLTDALAVNPFGSWPLWMWCVGFVAGFFGPDLHIEHKLAQRRARVLMELPVLCDMLTICASAGLGLEQALNVVALQSGGTTAVELQRVSREVAFGQRSLMGALESMAERNGVPELSRFVNQLQAAHQQGIPIVQALSAQSDALREEKRVRIVAEGAKAMVRMLVPAAVFIIPVYFVVLLGPPAMQVMGLSG